MTTRLPPVVVLGIDSPIGLTVVRELGEHGVEVHGVARNVRGVGLYSRALRRGYIRPAAPDALMPFLEDIARDSGAAFAMAISMNDVLALRTAADTGALARLRPLVPPMQQLTLVNDKLATCRVAAQLGIPVPATWLPTVEAFDTDDALPADLTFPCVLKWRDPDAVAATLHRFGIALLKAEFADDAAALRRALARYRPAGCFPLVQSFCAGQGLGQMFLMRDGEVQLRFQHRRIHEWPPEGGTSTLCESLPPDANAALMAQSEALLRHIGWQGPAMVEYCQDPATGRDALMEINGRFWGSLPLAYHAGAHFAWQTCRTLGLQLPPETTGYQVGVRCRYMVPESRRLLTILRNRGRTPDRSLHFRPMRELLEFLADFWRPSTHYYVFTWRDPRPFLKDVGFIALAIVNGVRAALGRRLGLGR